MTSPLVSRALSVAVLSVVALGIAFGTTSDRADAVGDIDLGISVVDDRANLISDAEAELGRNVDFVRLFNRWDDQFPSNNDLQLLNGRDAMISIKPIRDNNSRIPWADIALAQPGDPLYQDMVDWAQALEPYEDQIWITFHHEPEAGSNLVHGTDDEFVAAWRNFMSIMDAQGLDTLGRVWIMTDYSFQLSNTDRRAAAKWYPGDAWVEGIAADAYNWYDCRTGTEIGWLSLEDIIDDLRLFGQAHPNEELMLAEFGSVEDTQNPSRKAQWFQDAQALFAQPGFEQFTAISYFSLPDIRGNFNCDWRFTTSTQSTNAFVALADDPFYGGDGPVVEPPEPEDPCTATASGTGYDIEWSEPGTPVIRRNGSWLTTLGNGINTYFDAGAPANPTYQVIVYAGNSQTTLDCVTEGSPPNQPFCVGTVTGNNVELEWNLAGTPIVRRNGFWLASLNAGTTSYLDSSAPQGATYTVRVWPAGSAAVDLPCTLDGPISPSEACTATVNNGSVSLSWTVSGTVNLRKNGQWLAQVVGQQSFTDNGGNAADSYIVRSWVPGGGSIDYTCN